MLLDFTHTTLKENHAFKYVKNIFLILNKCMIKVGELFFFRTWRHCVKCFNFRVIRAFRRRTPQCYRVFALARINLSAQVGLITEIKYFFLWKKRKKNKKISYFLYVREMGIRQRYVYISKEKPDMKYDRILFKT